MSQQELSVLSYFSSAWTIDGSSMHLTPPEFASMFRLGSFLRYQQLVTAQHESMQLLDYKVFTKENTRQEMPLCQDPRFIGIRKGRNVSIHSSLGLEFCNSSKCNTTWYLGMPNGTFISNIGLNNDDPHFEIIGGKKGFSILKLYKIQKKHNGVYFCKFTSPKGEHTTHCGTELMVLGIGGAENVKSRVIMKDAIIIVQIILIVLFTVIPMMLLMEMKKKRSMKLEDHTYEGLEVYQSATYEDIQTVRALATKIINAEHPYEE
ncbi:B-cell antigen receptor complex-associated protein beta chain [Pelodytes ibericus]